jgi:hypothetical protein
VKALFSAFGRVEAVKCFRTGGAAPLGGLPPGSKGCGLVKMGSAAEAAAAIKALHEAFTWSGMPGPMVRPPLCVCGHARARAPVLRDTGRGGTGAR